MPSPHLVADATIAQQPVYRGLKFLTIAVKQLPGSWVRLVSTYLFDPVVKEPNSNYHLALIGMEVAEPLLSNQINRHFYCIPK